MAVKIVTDSVADLPPQVAEELGITMVPLYIQFGTETYLDGVDLTTDEFYARLTQCQALPTTSIPPLASFTNAYERLARETDEILVITISHKLSATYESALQAAKQMEGKCRIEVIDSWQAMMGEGLIAIAAAKLANEGASLDRLVELTGHNIPRAEMRIVFDTLEYLKRGGRIGKAQALLGSMLKVNPVLTVRDGETCPAGRERSRARAIDHLYNFARGFSHIDEIAVEDATTPDEAEALVERLGSFFPRERIYRSKVSPVIGTHVGPRVLGVAVLGDK